MNGNNGDQRAGLIEKAKFDRESFMYLVGLYYDDIFRFVFRRVFNRGSAEKITLQIFEQITGEFPGFSGNLRDFRRWIFGIACRQVNLFLKTDENVGEVQKAAEHQAGKQSAGLPDTNPEKVLLIKRAILSMKPRLQDVFSLRMYEDMDINVIGEVLERDSSVVRSQLLDSLESAERVIPLKASEKGYKDFVDEINFDDEPGQELKQHLEQSVRRILLKGPVSPSSTNRSLVLWFSAAGAVLLIIIGVIFFAGNDAGQTEDAAEEAQSQTVNAENDIRPLPSLEEETLDIQEKRTRALIERFDLIIKMGQEGDIEGLFNELTDERDPKIVLMISNFLAELGNESIFEGLKEYISEKGITDPDHPVSRAVDVLAKKFGSGEDASEDLASEAEAGQEEDEQASADAGPASDFIENTVVNNMISLMFYYDTQCMQ